MPNWTLNGRATAHRLFGLHGYEKDDDHWHQIYVAVTGDNYRNTTVISDDYKHKWKDGKGKMYKVNIWKRVDQYTPEELEAYNFARGGVNREAKRMGITLPQVRSHDDLVAQAHQTSPQQIATNAVTPRRALGSRRPRQQSIGENLTVTQPKQTSSQQVLTDAVATPRAPIPKKPVATISSINRDDGADAQTSDESMRRKLYTIEDDDGEILTIYRKKKSVTTVPAINKKNDAAASTNQVLSQQDTTDTAASPHAYMSKPRDRVFSSGSELSSIESDHEDPPRDPIPRKQGSTRPAIHRNVAQGTRTDHVASQQVHTVVADTPRAPIRNSKRSRTPAIDSRDEETQERNDARHSPQQGGRNVAAPVSDELPKNKKRKTTDYVEKEALDSLQRVTETLGASGRPVPMGPPPPPPHKDYGFPPPFHLLSSGFPPDPPRKDYGFPPPFYLLSSGFPPGPPISSGFPRPLPILPPLSGNLSQPSPWGGAYHPMPLPPMNGFEAEHQAQNATPNASKAQDNFSNAEEGRVQEPKRLATENSEQRTVVPGEDGAAGSGAKSRSKVEVAREPVVQEPQDGDEIMVDAGVEVATGQEAQKSGGAEDEIMGEAGEEAAVKTVLGMAANASADALNSMVNGMIALATSKAKIAPKEAGSTEVGATRKHSVIDVTTRAAESSAESARPKKSNTKSNSLPFFEELSNVSPKDNAARRDWRRANLDRILLEPFNDPFPQESKSSKKSSSREQVPVQPASTPVTPKERVVNFFSDMFNGELSKEYISSVFDSKQPTEEPGGRLERVFNTLSKEASKTSIKCRYQLRNVFISPKSPFSNFLLATAAFGHGLQMLHTSDVKFFGYGPSTPIACAKIHGSYHIAPEDIRFIDHDDLVFKRGGRVYKLYIRQQDCAILGADNRTNSAYVTMDVMLCQAFDCPKCSNVDDHGDPRVSISSLPRVHMRNLGDDNEFASPVIPLWRKHEHEKDEEEKFLVDLSYGTMNVKFWNGKRQPVAMCNKAECEGCLEAAEVKK
jgi:hypothetical protein